ncbi:MAG: trypsin-like peptidase domain-containing protein [Bacteroidota bacterium]
MKQILTTILVSLVVSGTAIGLYHVSLGRQQAEALPLPTEGIPEADDFAVQVTHRSMPGLAASEAPVDFLGAASKAMPAVVHIKSYQSYSRNSYDPFYEFFGMAPRKNNSSQHTSSGSGVIISSDGYIVTNNHVIKDADELTVIMADNRSYQATVIGTDPSTDLGLIKIQEQDLPTLELADSDQAQVGEWVLAVGNPFSLASTATAGIVSAIGRDLEIIKDQMAIESFIQTDAAVNPGNSGGALVNLEGRLLGVNTAIASPTGTYAGYAFAVPANIVKKVVTDLKQYGSVQRAFLGIRSARPLTGSMARKMGIPLTEGVLIEGVAEFGGAYKAGVKAGDIVVSIDGIKIRNDAKLLELVGRNRPGDIIDVKVYREKVYKTFKVTLTNEDGTTEILAPARNETLNFLGVEIRALTQTEMNRLGVERGILVSKLYAGKLRQETEIKENFIILKLNGQSVSDVDSLTKELEGYQGTLQLTGFYPRYNRLFTYSLELEGPGAKEEGSPE